MKIDLVVPTYNRPDDLLTFVNKIKSQDCDHYHVYIIDDCGDYDLEKIIPDNGKFTYVQLKENRGQAFARNYAVSISKSEILVFMDDDSYFLSDFSLKYLIDYFIDTTISGVMFNVKEPNRDWLDARKYLIERQEITGFIACGCAFRRTSFLNAGGFPQNFHSYGEETDISIEIVRNAEKIVFSKKIELYHNYNPGDRNLEWIKRFKTNSVRNDLIIVLNRYPLFLIFPFFCAKIFSHVRYTLTQERKGLIILKYIFNGVFQSINGFKRSNRKPLTLKQFKHWRKNRL